MQCAYGYYLEHWMSDEIIDCFSNSPEVSGTFVEGTYKGPEGIRRYFGQGRVMPPEFLHLVMQVSPVITVNKDGKTAHGRWYGYGTILSRPTTPLDPAYMMVIYEMDYIKEDGVWKILKLRLLMHYAYTSGRNPPPESKTRPHASSSIRTSGRNTIRSIPPAISIPSTSSTRLRARRPPRPNAMLR